MRRSYERVLVPLKSGSTNPFAFVTQRRNGSRGASHRLTPRNLLSVVRDLLDTDAGRIYTDSNHFLSNMLALYDRKPSSSPALVAAISRIPTLGIINARTVKFGSFGVDSSGKRR